MKMKIHPITKLFPLLPQEELQALADSIKANGLLYPVVKDKDGQLIDGRNRLEACKLAGVKPRFQQLNCSDPIEYILAVNAQRRHLTKAQLAMVYAMARPEPGKTGRKKKGKSGNGSDAEPFFQKGHLSEARQVLRHSEEMARDVIAGTLSLDAAYRMVVQEQQAKVADTLDDEGDTQHAAQVEEDDTQVFHVHEQRPAMTEGFFNATEDFFSTAEPGDTGNVATASDVGEVVNMAEKKIRVIITDLRQLVACAGAVGMDNLTRLHKAASELQKLTNAMMRSTKEVEGEVVSVQ
jgi:hypothetical protein